MTSIWPGCKNEWHMTDTVKVFGPKNWFSRLDFYSITGESRSSFLLYQVLFLPNQLELLPLGFLTIFSYFSFVHCATLSTPRPSPLLVRSFMYALSCSLFHARSFMHSQIPFYRMANSTSLLNTLIIRHGTRDTCISAYLVRHFGRKVRIFQFTFMTLSI